MAKWRHVVTIKIPLYNFDEDENMIPFTDDEAFEVFNEMTMENQFMEYVIDDYTLTKEEIE